jgi:hypothetical protein
MPTDKALRASGKVNPHKAQFAALSPGSNGKLE